MLYHIDIYLMKPINMNIVSMGALRESLIQPRKMMKSAILSNAHSFLIEGYLLTPLYIQIRKEAYTIYLCKYLSKQKKTNRKPPHEIKSCRGNTNIVNRLKYHSCPIIPWNPTHCIYFL